MLNPNVFKHIMGFAHRDHWPILFRIYCVYFKHPHGMHILHALELRNRFAIKYAALNCSHIFTQNIIKYGDIDIINFIRHKISSQHTENICAIGNLDLILSCNFANKISITAGVVRNGDLELLHELKTRNLIDEHKLDYYGSMFGKLDIIKLHTANRFAITHCL
jgi:hypothetical protein